MLFNLVSDLSFDQNYKDRLLVALWQMVWRPGPFLKNVVATKPHQVAKGKINSEIVKGWLNIKGSTNTFSAAVQEGPVTFQITFVKFPRQENDGLTKQALPLEISPWYIIGARAGVRGRLPAEEMQTHTALKQRATFTKGNWADCM